MNFAETCPDDVKTIITIWSKEKFWKTEKHDYGEFKEGLRPQPAKVVLTTKATEAWTQKQKHACLCMGSEWSVDATEAAGYGSGKQ